MDYKILRSNMVSKYYYKDVKTVNNNNNNEMNE